MLDIVKRRLLGFENNKLEKSNMSAYKCDLGKFV